MTVVFPASKRPTERPLGLAHAGPPDFRGGRASRCLLTPRPGRLTRGPDRVDNVLIASAPAEIALEPGADALLGRQRLSPEQFQRAHDHARGAETALQGVMLAKRRLQRMVGITWLAHARDRIDR
jgi:hypothetical protein